MTLQLTSMEQAIELFGAEGLMSMLDGISLKVRLQMHARAVLHQFPDFEATDWMIVYFIEVLTILLDPTLSDLEKDAAIQVADLPDVRFGR